MNNYENHLMMEKYLQYQLEVKRLKETTASTYRALLKIYLSYLSDKSLLADEMNGDLFVDFVSAAFTKDTPPRTQNATVRAIKYFHKFLFANGLVKKDLSLNIELPKVVKNKIIPPSNEDMARILDQPMKQNYNDSKNFSLAELLFSSGLRATEAISLRVHQVDILNQWVDVDGKGGKKRSVPFNEKTKNKIVDFLIFRSRKFPDRINKDDYLFLNNRKEPLTRQGVWHIVRALAKRAGFDKRVFPHLFRHAFATNLLEAGMDTKSVQELMGHSNLSTTDNYLHPRRKYLQSMYDEKHPRAKSSLGYRNHAGRMEKSG